MNGVKVSVSKMNAYAGIVSEENSDTTDVFSVTIINLADEWILDLGCSYHMSPNRAWFNTYQPIHGGKVLMRNNVAYKVVGICTIQIKMHDGIIRTLIDVRHVPELKKILISLGILDSNICTYKTRGGVLRILNDALVVMRGKEINGLYTFEGGTVTSATTVSTLELIIETIRLWHMWLRRMSDRGLTILSKLGLLDG